jgi:hypothetical protein
MYKILIVIMLIINILVMLLHTRQNRYITYFLLNKIYLHNKKKNKDIPKITNTTPIYIFMHLCNYGNNWKSIISNQIMQLIKSGLYAQCEKIFYGCSCNNCEEELQNFLRKYKKINKLPRQETYVHENITINKIIEFSKQQHKNVHILYIHSKGVTGRSNHQNYWRDFMMNYNVNMWKVCVNLLNNNYNTVGVNLLHNPMIHYSGNFWWGRSDYIKKLDYIDKNNNRNRLMAEYKILSKIEKNKHISLSNEYWISIFSSGLYSRFDFDHSLDYAEHEYYLKNPDELNIHIF